MEEVAKVTGVRPTPIAGTPAETYGIRKPRVGMYQRYGGGNMDEGWTRLMFEQFSVPFTSIKDADIKGGALSTNFDVIVLPADSIAAMTGERPAGGAGQPGQGGRGGGAGQGPIRRPPRIAAASAPKGSARSRRSCRKAEPS